MYVNKFELNLHQKAEGPIQQSCIDGSKVSRLNKFLLVLSPRNYVSTIGHVAYKQTLEDRVGSSSVSEFCTEVSHLVQVLQVSWW